MNFALGRRKGFVNESTVWSICSRGGSFMAYIQTALHLSESALEFVIAPPYCFLSGLCALAVGYTWRRQQRSISRLWAPSCWLFLTHLVFFGTAICLGVRYSLRPPGDVDFNQGVLALDTLWIGSLLSCALWIWRMKGIRLYASGLMTLLEMLTAGALFVAGVAVAGDWL